MIDIIIVTYNAKNKLRRCLDSIEKHTKNMEFSLTVVNNNSSDGTHQFLKNYKRRKINIINADKNLGFSSSANIALKNTSGSFIAFLDDDAEVTENWLFKLYGQIENNPNVGIVGCKIVFPNNRIFWTHYNIKILYSISFGEIDRGQRDYLKECDALVGSCWLMRREIIKKVGYFDKRFFPCQYEDIDYCLRTRLAGYKIIYNGEVKIIHHNLFRVEKNFGKNKHKFTQKWKNILYKFPLKDSHSVDRYIARGIDYLEKRKFKQALTKFREAESIDKRFSLPSYIGEALEGMGKYDDAIQQFEKVTDLDNLGYEGFIACYHLSLLYKKSGLIKEAKEKSLKAFDIISYHKKFLS